MTTLTLQFDFNDARKKFGEVIHTVIEENSLDPYKDFVQNFTASESEKRVTIDQAFRDVLRDISAREEGCEIYRRFICLSIDAVSGELCSASVPFLLLTDIFDVIPLDQCEELFGLVEDKVKVWKSATFYDTGKNFLLRMCNDLLRRLSKSQNTVFCGRIQLFLSRLFPLSEKSALNLMSQFNLENVTSYKQSKEEKPEGSEEQPEKMEVEEGEMDEKKSSVPIDYNLYRKFWALQDYFRRPIHCFEKKSWATFVANSDAVLEAFKSSKLDDLKSSKKKLSQKRTLDTEAFFAKYLTSEKLLDLQLNDSNFRRYVLVQFLIIFQYLNANVKFKLQAHTLTDEQSSWIKSAEETIYQLIKETPPDGENFAKTVEHILSREEHWNRWKNDGCPDFVMKPQEPAKQTKMRAKRRRIGDDLQASGGKVIKMGNPELTKLWNLNPSNMNACKDEKRMFLPSLEDFFQDAIEQNDPEQQWDEDLKQINDQTFQWKALRLLARRSPQFFTNTTTPALELKVYLTGMLSKLAKQMPTIQEEMKTGVEDEEEIKETQEDDDLKNNEQKEADGPQEIALNKDVIRQVGEGVGSDWKKLAVELGFPEDDISYFESEGEPPAKTAAKIITLWQKWVKLIQNNRDCSKRGCDRQVGEGVGSDWKKLAVELGFPEDDISYFESEGESPAKTAAKIITLWQENEADKACLAALQVALREVGLNEVAQSIAS